VGEPVAGALILSLWLLHASNANAESKLSPSTRLKNSARKRGPFMSFSPGSAATRTECARPREPPFAESYAGETQTVAARTKIIAARASE
jgi:hypothetical protein